MKIVVLGSNSFWGQDFISLVLEQTDARIIGVSRSPEKIPLFLSYKNHPDLDSRFQFYRFNLTMDFKFFLDLLNEEHPDWIVNFAAQSQVVESWEHPEQWIATNVSTPAKIVNHLCRQHFLKGWIQISTPEVYGSTEAHIVKEEEGGFHPSTPYAVSKLSADMLLKAYATSFGFPVMTIRAANIYGPRQQLYKIIPKAFMKLRFGKTLFLHGGGQTLRSFLPVRDASQGVLSALLKGRVGSVYHLSGDRLISIHNLVRLICEMEGKEFEDVCKESSFRMGSDFVYDLDDFSTRKELSLCPKATSLICGLEKTRNWIDENWEVLKEMPLEYLH